MDTKINIKNIQSSIEAIKTDEGSKKNALEMINKAHDDLDGALTHLNKMSVSGKKTLDILLGCIIAIESILGIEGE